MLLAARDKETGDGMTDKEIVDEITTLIVAGHETTASALNWTWYLLGEHPGSRSEAARRDRRQRGSARAFAAGDGSPALLQHGDPRGHAAVSAGVGGVAQDHRGRYARPGSPCRPDTDVFFSPYFVHRHPDFWSDAEQFMPRALRARRGR